MEVIVAILIERVLPFKQGLGSLNKGMSTLLRRACAKLWVETSCGVGFGVCETKQGQGHTNCDVADIARPSKRAICKRK